MARASKYKIRFAPTKLITDTQRDAIANAIKRSQPAGSGRSCTKSKSGCRECKRRHVKCDEQFPVCFRCQQRGTVCFSDSRLSGWRVEFPAITVQNAPNYLDTLGNHIDARLLQYWLERVSHVMVLDPDNNPLSFPILKLLGSCPWLASVLQSISSAYEHDFDPSHIEVALKQRSKALISCSQQLAIPDPPLAPMLLGAFLLGVSTSWIDGDVTQFGQAHLSGARILFDLLIKKPKAQRQEPADIFAIGTFIYWDMSCSLLVPPSEQKPLNTPGIFEAVCEMQDGYHPMSGYAIELYYLLGTVGRYCRTVLDSRERHLMLEMTIEEQLLNWESKSQENFELLALGEAFRQHGILLLYRICGVQRYDVGELFQDYDDEELIHKHALKGMRAISSLPITSNHMGFQPIPLLTIGSELRDEDVAERAEIVKRFHALYSLNRAPVNIWAMALLEEVWELRRGGERVSWAATMLCKNWNLTMG